MTSVLAGKFVALVSVLTQRECVRGEEVFSRWSAHITWIFLQLTLSLKTQTLVVQVVSGPTGTPGHLLPTESRQGGSMGPGLTNSPTNFCHLCATGVRVLTGSCLRR